jgi:hypothetical protein
MREKNEIQHSNVCLQNNYVSQKERIIIVLQKSALKNAI